MNNKIPGRVILIFKNIIWNFGETIIRIIFSLILTVLTLNHLGPKNFGIISYYLSIIIIFSPLAIFGLEQVTTRRVLQNPESIGLIIGSVFFIRSISCFAAFLFSVLAVLVLQPNNTESIVLSIISGITLLLLPMDTIVYYFRAVLAARIIAISRLLALLGSSIATILFIFLDGDLWLFLLVRPIEVFITGVALIFFCRDMKGASFRYWKINRIELKALLLSAFPNFIGSIFVVIYMRVDQIIIREFSGDIALGSYSAAVRFVEALNIIPSIIVTTIFPSIVNKYINNRDNFNFLLKNIISFLFFLCLILSVLSNIVSPFVFMYMISDDYFDTPFIFKINVWNLPATALGLVIVSTLVAQGRFWLVSLTAGLGALFNVCILLLIVPYFGVFGASYSSVATNVFVSFIVLWILPQTRDLALISTKAILQPEIKWMWYEVKKRLKPVGKAR